MEEDSDGLVAPQAAPQGPGAERSSLAPSSFTCSICMELLVDPVVGEHLFRHLRGGPDTRAQLSESAPAVVLNTAYPRPLHPAGSCGHDFCKRCIDQWRGSCLRNGRCVQCPVCRTQLLSSPCQTFGECTCCPLLHACMHACDHCKRLFKQYRLRSAIVPQRVGRRLWRHVHGLRCSDRCLTSSLLGPTAALQS